MTAARAAADDTVSLLLSLGASPDVTNYCLAQVKGLRGDVKNQKGTPPPVFGKLKRGGGKIFSFFDDSCTPNASINVLKGGEALSCSK